ncbi:SURF1 family protein [Phytoactinopolyspora endophytica]|uniref:SURF1 family cytochrome oxidase biogenesis protein n=1 Tax=Phytoactinopolyspora endophytica TaxID=1642495 RepID=UPI0013ED805C|nr:SURF1 family protein [Phytoactinopolyspora endophytica]
MYRFLVSRRWLVRTFAGILLVLACVRLGMWQLDRDEERSERNEIIEANEDAPPAQLEDVLGPDPASGTLDESEQWRHVEVTGRYDADHELLLRLRPLNGTRGFHVVTPLVTEDGTAILVDRGFYPSDETEPEVPSAPSGEVTVTARLRESEDQREAGDAAGGRIRYVNVEQIADALPYPLTPAWAEAIEPIGEDLVALPAPDVDTGPHLSYAFQWFIFAVVGVTGYVLLVRAEAKGRRSPPSDLDAGRTPEDARTPDDAQMPGDTQTSAPPPAGDAVNGTPGTTDQRAETDDASHPDRVQVSSRTPPPERAD